MEFLSSLDKQIFLWINSWAESSWDYLFAWPTYGGTYLVLIPMLALIWIWDGGKVGRKAAALAAGGFLGGLFAQILKTIFDMPRPYAVFSKQHIFIHCIFDMPITGSFPSGHTASIFTLVTLLIYFYGRKMLLLYLFALWVGITRIYVGAHFPSDVLGGAVVGILAGVLIIRISKRYPSFLEGSSKIEGQNA